MELFAICPDGSAPGLGLPLPESVAAVIPMCCELYGKVGFHPPWVCYCAVENGEVVGTCAFKSPPNAGRVELAYYTLPQHEGRGFATKMAAELVRLAHEAAPALTIAAQTLPTHGPSTSVLRKLGFALHGAAQHPEDGTVWEWRIPRG